jgi:hypothetical protein
VHQELSEQDAGHQGDWQGIAFVPADGGITGQMGGLLDVSGRRLLQQVGERAGVPGGKVAE